MGAGFWFALAISTTFSDTWFSLFWVFFILSGLSAVVGLWRVLFDEVAGP